MAVKPVKIYDNLGRLVSTGGGNRLYNASNLSQKRKRIPSLDIDSFRTVSGYGRRKMLSVGRFLWANFAEVKGVVTEIADYTTSIFQPQFQTADEEWNVAAEKALKRHDRIADIRGSLSSMSLIRWNMVKSVLIDGDFFILFVKNREGYPQLQVIPGHRCYSQTDEILSEGKFKGNNIYDGAIYDGFGRAVAYRIYNADGEAFRDISARDIVHCYLPEWSDQQRGFSILGQSLFDWLDISESRQFELMAQKLGASVSLMEFNDNGEPDVSSPFLAGQSSTDTDETPSGLVSEWIDDGTRYFKARNGSRLEAFSNDRPTENQQQFTESIMRATFYGLRWSYDFSMNQTNIGGASMRVAVRKVNDAIKYYQDRLVEPVMRRIDSWRIASLANAGAIEQNAEMFEFCYQRGARLSADSRYDSDRDIQESEQGWLTDSQAIAARGGDIESHYRQQARDIKAKERIFADEGVVETLPQEEDEISTDDPED